MSDEERDRRAIARLLADIGKSDEEKAEEQAIVAAFRHCSRDIRGRARIPYIVCFIVEMVEMKVRRTKGLDRAELRAELYADALWSPRGLARIALMMEPTIEA